MTAANLPSQNTVQTPLPQPIKIETDIKLQDALKIQQDAIKDIFEKTFEEAKKKWEASRQAKAHDSLSKLMLTPLDASDLETISKIFNKYRAPTENITEESIEKINRQLVEGYRKLKVYGQFNITGLEILKSAIRSQQISIIQEVIESVDLSADDLMTFECLLAASKSSPEIAKLVLSKPEIKKLSEKNKHNLNDSFFRLALNHSDKILFNRLLELDFTPLYSNISPPNLPIQKNFERSSLPPILEIILDDKFNEFLAMTLNKPNILFYCVSFLKQALDNDAFKNSSLIITKFSENCSNLEANQKNQCLEKIREIFAESISKGEINKILLFPADSQYFDSLYKDPYHLYLAVKHHNIQLANEMIQKGSDPTEALKYIFIVPVNFFSDPHDIKPNHLTGVKVNGINPLIQIIHTFVDLGADINALNYDVKGKKATLACFLFNCLKDRNIWPPEYIQAWQKLICNRVTFLCSKGASLAARDNNGPSAFEQILRINDPIILEAAIKESQSLPENIKNKMYVDGLRYVVEDQKALYGEIYPYAVIRRQNEIIIPETLISIFKNYHNYKSLKNWHEKRLFGCSTEHFAEAVRHQTLPESHKKAISSIDFFGRINQLLATPGLNARFKENAVHVQLKIKEFLHYIISREQVTGVPSGIPEELKNNKAGTDAFLNLERALRRIVPSNDYNNALRNFFNCKKFNIKLAEQHQKLYHQMLIELNKIIPNDLNTIDLLEKFIACQEKKENFYSEIEEKLRIILYSYQLEKEAAIQNKSAKPTTSIGSGGKLAEAENIGQALDLNNAYTLISTIYEAMSLCAAKWGSELQILEEYALTTIQRPADKKDVKKQTELEKQIHTELARHRSMIVRRWATTWTTKMIEQHQIAGEPIAVQNAEYGKEIHYAQAALEHRGRFLGIPRAEKNIEDIVKWNQVMDDDLMAFFKSQYMDTSSLIDFIEDSINNKQIDRECFIDWMKDNLHEESIKIKFAKDEKSILTSINITSYSIRDLYNNFISYETNNKATKLEPLKFYQDLKERIFYPLWNSLPNNYKQLLDNDCQLLIINEINKLLPIEVLKTNLEKIVKDYLLKKLRQSLQHDSIASMQYDFVASLHDENNIKRSKIIAMLCKLNVLKYQGGPEYYAPCIAGTQDLLPSAMATINYFEDILNMLPRPK